MSTTLITVDADLQRRLWAVYLAAQTWALTGSEVELLQALAAFDTPDAIRALPATDARADWRPGKVTP